MSLPPLPTPGSDSGVWDDKLNAYLAAGGVGVYRVDVAPYNATTSSARAGIQAAINDAHAAGGGTVFVPPGTWTVDDTVWNLSYTKLRGAGMRQTVIKLAAGVSPNADVMAAGDTIGGVHGFSEIAIEDLTVDGTRDETATDQLGGAGCGFSQGGLVHGFYVRRCRIINCNAYGMGLEGGCTKQHIHVEDCEFENCGRDCIDEKGSRDGSSIYVRNNRFLDYGINTTFAGGATAAVDCGNNMIVTENIIESIGTESGVDRCGISLNAGSHISPSNATSSDERKGSFGTIVANNVIYCTGAAVSDALQQDTSPAVGSLPAGNNLIVNNLIGQITCTTMTQGSDNTAKASYTTASVPGPSGTEPDDERYLKHGRLYLLAVVHNETGATAPTVTGMNMTWVNVTSAAVSASNRLSLFRAMAVRRNPPTTGALTITPATAGGRCMWYLIEVRGASRGGTNGSAAIAQSVTGTGTSTTGLATLGAFAQTNNGTIGFFGHLANENFTVGSGFTACGTGYPETTFQGGSSSALSCEWKQGNDTAVDATWATNTGWAAIAVEIRTCT